MYYFNYPCHEMVRIKFVKNFFHFELPEICADLLVNSFIAKYGKLAIFNGDIHYYTIPVICLLHFQSIKHLDCPVKRVNETTTALYIHSYLTTGLLFSGSDSLYNSILFLLGEELFLFTE